MASSPGFVEIRCPGCDTPIRIPLNVVPGRQRDGEWVLKITADTAPVSEHANTCPARVITHYPGDGCTDNV